MNQVKIDIGCGGKKRAGFIGLDYIYAPGVDHVLDLTKDTFPFEKDSVDYVYSSHFLEHITVPNHVFQEIGRICREGARIEFWTPYAFSNEAFVYGHTTFLTEEPWMHFCVHHRDAHLQLLGGRWLLKNINFVVLPHVEDELLAKKFSVDFAIRYFKNVVSEFGVEIEFSRNLKVSPIMPKRTFSHSRSGKRFLLPGI